MHSERRSERRSESQTGAAIAARADSERPRQLASRLWQADMRVSALTMADQVVYSACNFLTAVIVARSCAAREFGLYILGLRLIDYLREVEGILISAPYVFFSPRLQGAERARYTGSTLVHQLSFSFGGAALFVLAAFALPLFSQPAGLVSAMWPLAFVAVTLPLQEYSRRICFANFQTVAVIVLDATVMLLQLGGLALLARMEKMTINNAYWVIGAANGFAALCWLIWAQRALAIAGDQALVDFRRNFARGRWLLASNLTLLADRQFFPWSLGAFHGTAATGAYAACEGVINFIRAFLASVGNFLGPRLAHARVRGGVEEVRRVVRRAALLLGLATGMLCVIAAVFGGALVKLIYGARYHGLHPIVALLAANIFVNAVTTAHAYALSMTEGPDLNFRINLIGLALTVTAGLILVKAFGPIGAACGLLISTLVTGLLKYAAFERQSKKDGGARARKR